MSFDLHPIIVHFPIALLFLYSLIKILPLERFVPQFNWRHIRQAFLAFGFLGAAASLMTGEIAESLSRPNHQVVEMHSTFAALATWLYGILLVSEFIVPVNEFLAKKNVSALLKVTTPIAKLLAPKFLNIVLAIVALVAIFVTGLLGGVMVYGTSADPLAPMVLSILGINF